MENQYSSNKYWYGDNIYKPERTCWHGGLQLHPQHFQILERRIDFHDSMHSVLKPYDYGIHYFNLSQSQLDKSNFQIDDAIVRFQNGTLIKVEDNAVTSDFNFSQKFEDSKTKQLFVYIGIRKFIKQNSQTVDVSLDKITESNLPFVINNTQLSDETDDINDSEKKNIKTKCWNVKTFIESEHKNEKDMLYNEYDLLLVGTIVKSNKEPRKLEFRLFAECSESELYIPPLLRLDFSQQIMNKLNELTDQIDIAINIINRKLSNDKVLIPDTSKALILLPSLCGANGILKHYQSDDNVHPYSLFLILIRLLYEVYPILFNYTTSNDDDAQKWDTDIQKWLTYNHDNLWQLCLLISHVKSIIEENIYIESVKNEEGTTEKEIFSLSEKADRTRLCTLKEEWINKNCELFISIDQEDQKSDVVDSLIQGFKILPESKTDSGVQGLIELKTKATGDDRPKLDDKEGRIIFYSIEKNLIKGREHEWKKFNRNIKNEKLAIQGIDKDVLSKIEIIAWYKNKD